MDKEFEPQFQAWICPNCYDTHDQEESLDFCIRELKKTNSSYEELIYFLRDSLEVYAESSGYKREGALRSVFGNLMEYEEFNK